MYGCENFYVQSLGARIVIRALDESLRQIAANAGNEGAAVVQLIKTEKNAIGYDAETGKFEGLMIVGVLDPTKIVRAALHGKPQVSPACY